MPPFVERSDVPESPRGELAAPLVRAAERVIRRVESHTPGRPPGPRRRGATVQIGYVNRNQQKMVFATGLPGTDHGQSVYVLRCGLCGNEYGSNGSDNFQRKCPECQGGAPGLPYA